MTTIPSTPPSKMRPIRPTELSGIALMVARDASGRERKAMALMSGLNPWTFRLAELCTDRVRLPSSRALAVLDTYAKLGISLWIDEDDSVRLRCRNVNALRALQPVWDVEGQAEIKNITPEVCRHARVVLGLSQRKMATLSGVSYNTLRRFEEGRQVLRHNKAKLVMVLMVHAPEMLDRSLGSPKALPPCRSQQNNDIKPSVCVRPMLR